MNAEIQTRRPTRLEALKRALDQGTMRQVHRLVNSLHPAEVASLLESLPPTQREVVWELVDPELEGDVLVELNDEVRAGLIRDMDTEELVAAAEGLEVDDLADLLSELPETVNQQVLRSMDSQDRERLHAGLGFDEDTAGGLMNTDTVSVRPDVTLETVLRYRRMRGEMGILEGGHQHQGDEGGAADPDHGRQDVQPDRGEIKGMRGHVTLRRRWGRARGSGRRCPAARRTRPWPSAACRDA